MGVPESWAVALLVHEMGLSSCLVPAGLLRGSAQCSSCPRGVLSRAGPGTCAKVPHGALSSWDLGGESRKRGERCHTGILHACPPLLAFCLLALQWDHKCERKAPGELESGVPGHAEHLVLHEGRRCGTAGCSVALCSWLPAWKPSPCQGPSLFALPSAVFSPPQGLWSQSCACSSGHGSRQGGRHMQGPFCLGSLPGQSCRASEGIWGWAARRAWGAVRQLGQGLSGGICDVHVHLLVPSTDQRPGAAG